MNQHILMPESLAQLVKMTNKELRVAEKERLKELYLIDKHLQEKGQRLQKVYEAIETGKVDLEILGPRISELKGQIEALGGKRGRILEASEKVRDQHLDSGVVASQGRDLMKLLQKGTLHERKTFFQSFLKRVVVNHPEVTLEYSVPYLKRKTSTDSDAGSPMVDNWLLG